LANGWPVCPSAESSAFSVSMTEAARAGSPGFSGSGGAAGSAAECLAVGPVDLDRGDAVERPRSGRHGNLCRIGAGIDLIGELGIPVAEAVRGVLQPIEIVFGAAAQCFLGGGEAIIERLQLRNLGE
jgi:hypothetical protein